MPSKRGSSVGCATGNHHGVKMRMKKQKQLQKQGE